MTQEERTHRLTDIFIEKMPLSQGSNARDTDHCGDDLFCHTVILKYLWKTRGEDPYGPILFRLYLNKYTDLYYRCLKEDELSTALGALSMCNAEKIELQKDILKKIADLIVGWRGRLIMANAKDFTEDGYLSANLDVWYALQKGGVTSGLEHFLTHGINESRKMRVHCDDFR